MCPSGTGSTNRVGAQETHNSKTNPQQDFFKARKKEKKLGTHYSNLIGVLPAGLEPATH